MPETNPVESENEFVPEPAPEETPAESVNEPVPEPEPEDTPDEPENEPVQEPAPEETPVETSQPAEHVHNWQPVYKTVHHAAFTLISHHDAVYETVHHDAVTEEQLVGYNVTHDSAKFNNRDKDGNIVEVQVFDPYDYNYDVNAYLDAISDYQENYCIPNNFNTAFASSNVVEHYLSVEYYNSIDWDHSGAYEYWKDPVYETVVVQEAYDEQVMVQAAYDETVVDTPAYDEQVLDHYECECGATK